MQIYTKILIGMVVGVLLGLFFGPNSIFLEKNTYKIRHPSSYHWYKKASDKTTLVEFPNLGSANDSYFQIQHIQYEKKVDSNGNTHSLADLAKVKFQFTESMVLRDINGKFRQALGNPELNEWVDIWLRIQHVEMQGKGFVSFPEPINGWGSRFLFYLSPIGKIFLRLIMMVIVPLVFASLLVGVASLGDVRKLGRIGGKTISLYLVTTALAVSIGLLSAHIIKPGRFMDIAAKTRLQAEYHDAAGAKVNSAAQAPSAMDNILSIVPDNPLESMSSGNMLQIIFFAILFGIALSVLPQQSGQLVIQFFDKVQQAMVVIIHMVMTIAPYGVAALVAEVVGASGLSVLMSLFTYGLTVMIGLLLHAGIVYGLLLRLLTRVRLGTFLKSIRSAQVLAFSTSSSSATLPVTMECAENNLGISKPVSSFVLPLGATVNMDGTALYQGVAALFIAQVFQMDLSFGAQIGIVLTATVASIGAAGVPGAGMITLALVLTANGIPAVGIALILGLDRILDMFRTMINVTGDLTVTSIMAVTEGESLKVDR